MATYAVGDIQGCFDDLLRLLSAVSFDPKKDTLWCAGDLVNRGPQSLETLRFVKNLGDSAKVVLGNHDLHLLAISMGNHKHASEDSLDDVLNAPDSHELLHWLRHQPLLHEDKALNWCMIHAGLPPQWTLTQAKHYAQEVERVLQGDEHPHFFANMYGNKPNLWHDSLTGMARLRFITNCFTRLRYCADNGALKLKEKQAPSPERNDIIPWFDMPDRQSEAHPIIFGHWSTLGYHQHRNTICLDSGCLWGGTLTLIELCQPIRTVSVACAAKCPTFSEKS